MSIKQIQNPATWYSNVTSDSTSTTFTLSTTDAGVIDSQLDEFSSALLVLITKPASRQQETSLSQVVTVSAANTGTGACTCDAITNFAKYTVASGTTVSMDLMPDGSLEWFGTQTWSINGSLDYYTKIISGSYSGAQCLAIEGAAAGAYIYQNVTLPANKEFYFSAYCKEEVGDCYLKISGSNSSLVSTAMDSTSWKKYNTVFTTSGTGTCSIQFHADGDGAILYIDNISLTQNMLVNGGFEPNGANIVINGGFDADNTWYKGTSGWTISGGKANASTAVGNLSEDSSVAKNKYYYTKYTLTRTAGTVQINLGGYTNGTARSTDNTFEQILNPTNALTNVAIYFIPASSFAGTIDNVVVQEISGWSVSNATFTLDSDNERSGSWCGKITASAALGYVYQTVAVNAYSWYSAIFHGKGASAGRNWKITITGDISGKTYYDSGYVDSTTYLNKGCTFQTDQDTSITIKGIIQTNGHIVYFDDWALTPLITYSPTIDVVTSGTSSYGPGVWGDNAYGSVYIDGGDLYCIGLTSGTSLCGDKGAIDLYFRPNFNYNGAIDTPYLFNIENFCRLYYSGTDARFYGDMYDGTDFKTIVCSGIQQIFVSGTWINIGMIYNNTTGMKLIVSGILEDEYDGTWTEQCLPNLITIGGVSGTCLNRGNGYFDDIITYNSDVSGDIIRMRYLNENHDTE